ncbi:MAG TPA: hypothetical protein VMV40_09065 [Acidiferrobacter sp.]|nr:hypothetical protein [Acidiferrobacter sp.]
MAVGLVVSTAAMASTRYKPFVLGHEDATSSMSEAVTAARAALTTNGFQVVGQYVPFAHTTILCATYPELLNAAAHARHGSFGAVERISVTRLNGKLQVSYENPQYTAVAYGLGALPKTTAALKAALGAEQVFGSARGLTRDELEPGEYHYALFMPYFNDIYRVGKFANHAAAVNTIRTNLMKHVATTSLVYEVNVPGTKEPTTVFGIGIKSGTAGDYHILNLIDQHPLRGYAYLPYEMMVVGRRVISLRPRFRIAVNFPDTSMMGSHGFMSIIDAPGAIRHVLDQVAGQNDN